jgi:hypothetical protein
MSRCKSRRSACAGFSIDRNCGRRKVIEGLAHLLLEKEVVAEEEFRKILSKSKLGIAASVLGQPS